MGVSADTNNNSIEFIFASQYRNLCNVWSLVIDTPVHPYDVLATFVDVIGKTTIGELSQLLYPEEENLKKYDSNNPNNKRLIGSEDMNIVTLKSYLMNSHDFKIQRNELTKSYADYVYVFSTKTMEIDVYHQFPIEAFKMRSIDVMTIDDDKINFSKESYEKFDTYDTAVGPVKCEFLSEFIQGLVKTYGNMVEVIYNKNKSSAWVTIGFVSMIIGNSKCLYLQNSNMTVINKNSNENGYKFDGNYEKFISEFKSVYYFDQ